MKMNNLSSTESPATDISRPVSVNLNSDSNNQDRLRSRSTGQLHRHMNTSQATEPMMHENQSLGVLQENNNNITPRVVGQALREIGDQLNFRYLLRNNQNG